MIIVDLNVSIKKVKKMVDTEYSEKTAHYNNKEYVKMEIE